TVRDRSRTRTAGLHRPALLGESGRASRIEEGRAYMFSSDENRREFVKRTAAVALTAASYNRVLGANSRVRVANVGCGRRGLLRELSQIKDDAQLDVAAVCDTWKQKREKAEVQVKEFTGQTPFSTARMEDVLTRKDIDAVVIGTPDHLHCAQLIAAIRAG